jgi:hypothetical protein
MSLHLPHTSLRTHVSGGKPGEVNLSSDEGLSTFPSLHGLLDGTGTARQPLRSRSSSSSRSSLFSLLSFGRSDSPLRHPFRQRSLSIRHVLLQHTQTPCAFAPLLTANILLAARCTRPALALYTCRGLPGANCGEACWALRIGWLCTGEVSRYLLCGQRTC